MISWVARPVCSAAKRTAERAARAGELGVGEALVSVLDQRGVPAPVERTLIAGAGGELAYERTSFGGSVSANLIRGSDVLDIYSFQVDCGPDFDVDRVEEEITKKLALAKVTASVSAGELPVVLTPMAFMMTVGPALGVGCHGTVVEQGASPAAGQGGVVVPDRLVGLWRERHGYRCHRVPPRR